MLSQTQAATDKTEAAFYDANAEQRHELTAIADGEKYQTAHRIKPIEDERYLAYLKAVDIKGDDEDVDSHEKESGAAFWDDLIIEVENVEFEEGSDWKALIDADEKNEALNLFLAVAIIEPETVSNGKRKLTSNASQTIRTEAYFNGVPIQQTHKLQAKTPELIRKYDRIQRNRFKQEPTKGLRRKPKMIYVPQDRNIAALYDEMFIEQTGFANGIIPCRFKTSVIHYCFAPKVESKVDAKKS